MLQQLVNRLPMPVQNKVNTFRNGIELNWVTDDKKKVSAERLLAEEKAKSLLYFATMRGQFYNPKIGQLAEIMNPNDEEDLGICIGERKLLYGIAATLRPQHVLEIGTHVGQSTVALAMGMKRGVIDTVDINDMNAPGNWNRYRAFSGPQSAIERLGVNVGVSFIVADSIQFLKTAWSGYDLIFIDGDHAAKTAYQEISLSLGLLQEGGMIVLHDYHDKLKSVWPERKLLPGPYLATQQLMRQCPELRVIPVGTLPWETKLGSKNCCLAVLCRA